MKIGFVSRADMKKYIEHRVIDTNKEVVISVSDTFEEEVEMNDLLEKSMCLDNFLTMNFADNEDDFEVLDAKQVLKFINRHGTKKDYIIHCFAGISRSGAIAKFINEYFEAGIFYLEDYKGYNRHVFNTLHKAAGTSLATYYEELEKQDRKYRWEGI